MARNRSGLQTVVLVVVMLGSSLLTAGVMEGVRQEPSQFQSGDPLDLDAFTVYSNGVPVLEVDGDDVRLLQEWAPTRNDSLSVTTAGASCPAGGVAVGGTALCNGTQGPPGAQGPEGPQGPPGPAGVQRLLVKSFAREPNGLCPMGGFMIALGIDDGEGLGDPDDGELQADEIDVEQDVCHGAGERGPAGPMGPRGADGRDGARGQDGAATAFRIESVPAGATCQHGGVWVYMGADDGDPGGIAGDGQLQPAEDTGEEVVCSTMAITEGAKGDKGEHGTNGTDGENGEDGEDGWTALIDATDASETDCQHGGVTIRWGLDDGSPDGWARNGNLEAGERDGAKHICSPVGTTSGLSDGCDTGSVVADDEGGLACAGSTIWPYTVASQNVLRTVHDTPDDGDPAMQAALTLDPLGLPLMVYAHGAGVEYHRCLDPLCDRHSERLLAPGGRHPAIALRAPDEVYIGYIQSNTAHMVICSTVTCASPSFVSLGSSASPLPIRSTALRIASDGNPSLVHSWGGQGYVTHCEDPACTTTSTNMIGTGSHVTTAVDWNGDLLVAGWDQDDEVRLVRCTDAACSTRTTKSFNEDATAGPVAVAVGSDGNPLLAYRRGPVGNYGLAVIHCEDPDCSSFTHRLLSGIDHAGYPSIAIGHDGLPAIAAASISTSSSEWQYIKCRDVACDRWVASVHDAPGGSWYTDIAIGHDGRPYVSLTSMGERLHLTRLANPYGTEWWAREG